MIKTNCTSFRTLKNFD